MWAYITVFMIGESAIHFRSEEAANVFNMYDSNLQLLNPLHTHYR